MPSVVSKRQDGFLDLQSKAYKRVVDHGSEGILQNILWKELILTSKDGMELVVTLEKRGMIRREKVLADGTWTYKLTPLRVPVRIRSIEQVPCITCPYESKCSTTGVVSPISCPWIVDWVIKEFRESGVMGPNDSETLQEEQTVQARAK